MLENPWIKKDAGISKEELDATAKKALERAEAANPAATLDILKDGRTIKEIKERFPVTNDDTFREDSAVRSVIEKSDDADARKTLGDEARKAEKSVQEQMEELRDDLADIHEQIMKEMEDGAKQGIFAFGKRSPESQAKLTKLENEYDRLETKVKELYKAWYPKNPEKN